MDIDREIHFINWDKTSQENFERTAAYKSILDFAEGRNFYFIAFIGTGFTGKWTKIAGAPEFEVYKDGRKCFPILFKDNANTDLYFTGWLELDRNGVSRGNITFPLPRGGRMKLLGLDTPVRNEYEEEWKFQLPVIALAQLLEIPVVKVLPGPLSRTHIINGQLRLEQPREGRQHTEVYFYPEKNSKLCFPVRFYFNNDDSLDILSATFSPQQYEIETFYNVTCIDMNVRPEELHSIVRACAVGSENDRKKGIVKADFWFDFTTHEGLLARRGNAARFNKHPTLLEYHQNHEYWLLVNYYTDGDRYFEQRRITLHIGGNVLLKRYDYMFEKQAKPTRIHRVIGNQPFIKVQSHRTNEDFTWPHFEAVRMMEMIAWYVYRDTGIMFVWGYIRSYVHTLSYGEPVPARITVVFKTEENPAEEGYNAHLMVRAWEPDTDMNKVIWPLELVAVEWFTPNNQNPLVINTEDVVIWRGGEWLR